MAYQIGALRELFEESGILLAKTHAHTDQLVSIPQDVLDEGRRKVHSGKMSFQSWLKQECPTAILDTGNLIPFSHWITPSATPRRFTTQIYLYVLPGETPYADTRRSPEAAHQPTRATQPIAQTTASSDGGFENTAATFLPAHEWLRLAQLGTIILFPPQFLLLHLISNILDKTNSDPRIRIKQLRDFITHRNGQPPPSPAPSPAWSEKCISPYTLTTRRPRRDGKVILGLDKPGPEVQGTGLRGDDDHVVLLKWSREGPRELEVCDRREVLEEGESDEGTGSSTVKL